MSDNWLEDDLDSDMAVDRTSRTAETRESQTRKVEWKPPSSLDAPPAPPGFKHRWIRAEAGMYQDAKNVSSRLREGFEFVRADDPVMKGFHAPVVDSGRYEGLVGVGGLLLARVPEEIVEQRNRHYNEVAESRLQAVDNDLLRENSHPSMRIGRPERRSHVSFGGPRPQADD